MRGLLYGAVAASCACIGCGAGRALHRVPVNPTQPGTFAEYVARGKRVEIVFTNAAPDRDVDVFPEPPLTIREQARSRSCQIQEGGSRVREAVYLSTDECTLVALEYSGSNDWLAVYETSSCRTLEELSVTGTRWRLEGDSLELLERCSSEDAASCRVAARRSLPHGRCAP